MAKKDNPNQDASAAGGDQPAEESTRELTPPVGGPEADFIAKIVGDPVNPPDAVLLSGFLGRSSEPDYTRLYFDASLSSYVEIPNDAILFVQPQPAEGSPLPGASYVWIRRDAELISGKAGPNRYKAKFFEGPIAQDYLGSGASGGAGGGAGGDAGAAQTPPISAPPNCPTVQQCPPTWQPGCGLLSAPPNCPTVQQCPPTWQPHCGVAGGAGMGEAAGITLATVCTQAAVCYPGNTLATLCTHFPQACPPTHVPQACPPANTLATVCTQPVVCRADVAGGVGGAAQGGPISAPPNCPTVQQCPPTWQPGCGLVSAFTHCPTVPPVCQPTWQPGCGLLSSPPHCPTVSPPCGGGGVADAAPGPVVSAFTHCPTVPPMCPQTSFPPLCPPLSAPPNCPTVQQCPPTWQPGCPQTVAAPHCPISAFAHCPTIPPLCPKTSFHPLCPPISAFTHCPTVPPMCPQTSFPPLCPPISAPPNCPTVQQCPPTWQPGCGAVEGAGEAAPAALVSAPPNCPTVQQCPPTWQPGCGLVSAVTHCPTVPPMCPQFTWGSPHCGPGPVSMHPNCPTMPPGCGGVGGAAVAPTPPVASLGFTCTYVPPCGPGPVSLHPINCPSLGIACTFSPPCWPHGSTLATICTQHPVVCR